MPEAAQVESAKPDLAPPGRSPLPVGPGPAPDPQTPSRAPQPADASSPEGVARLQSVYGNAYASGLVERLRTEPAAEPETETETEPAEPSGAQPAPVPTPPAPAPAPESVSAPVSVSPPAGAPAPQAASARTDAGASVEVPAAESPEPAAPAPASGAAPELTGEEPAGAQVEADAVAAEGAAAEAGSEETAREPSAPGETEGGESDGEAAAEAGGEGEAAEAAPADRAPASPEEDPAFQAVVARTQAVARKQGHNSPAQQKAVEAQAAAPGPANELSDGAAGKQVGKMAQQEPAPFDKESFKAALMAKIEAITPKNLKQADDFKSDGRAAGLKGDVVSNVEQSKEGAQAPVAKTAAETPDPGSVEPKPVAPLPPTDPGAPPPDVGAQAAAPKPKSDSEVSLQQNSQELDDLASSSDPPFDEELVSNSNEPEFQTAYDAKTEAQQDAAERPAGYRADEQAVLAGAEQEAAADAVAQTQEMHQTRGDEFGQIVGAQAETQTEDQSARQQVLAHIRGIYDRTKQQVDERLDRLDEEVDTAFDGGAEDARLQFESYVDQRMRAYKSRRYSGVIGKGKWLKDKLLGLPDEVNVFYVEARNLYLQLMEGVIDRVAGIVADGLNEAMGLIAAGQQEIQTYVATLEGDLRAVGEQGAQNIQSRFDSLAQSVRDRQDRLVDSLAQRYQDNLSAIDARIEEMKAANRGLVDAALDAVKGVIETIIKLKNMLLGVLARAADVIGTILKDPIGFLGNLVAAVQLGLSNFVANIGTHLQQGLMGWLFGALAEAGIQMPASFDLQGILSLVMQVLGLTYANIRARAVAIVGEPIVQALEQAAEVFKILITQGPGGLWTYIKDQIGNLRDIVIEGIKSFVIERIIMAGVTWLLSMLNPASAFIKACKMIYDVVMFFVTRAAQIASFVNAVLDSLSAIASGAIGGAAAAVEGALARALPVVISFLASVLGLGGISQKIREIIQRVQAPINAAIDWVINKAVSLVKAAGRLLGFGKKDEEEVEEHDPEKAAKVQAGLAAIDQTQQTYLDEEGQITREDAEKVASSVAQQHPVFTSLTVQEGPDRWDYRYTASPTAVHTGPPRDDGEDLELLRMEYPSRLFAQEEAAGVGFDDLGTNLPQWVSDSELHELKPRGGRDPFTTVSLYAFDATKASRSTYSGRRAYYGYSNPSKDSAVGIQILAKGVENWDALPDDKSFLDREWHQNTARYRCVRTGATGLTFSQVILGHAGEGASGHFNTVGHTQPKASNQAWNRSAGSYQGPEDASASSASGSESDFYRIPAAFYGSNSEWW